jgi:hypothetical protein
MQILGELAFIAFLAALGRELYRWAQRGRLRYRRMLAAGGCSPSTERHHLRVAARLFLGAGIFFLLYLIPASAHAADPLADDLIEVGGAVTDETSGLNEVEVPDVVPTVDKRAVAGNPHGVLRCRPERSGEPQRPVRGGGTLNVPGVINFNHVEHGENIYIRTS